MNFKNLVILLAISLTGLGSVYSEEEATAVDIEEHCPDIYEAYDEASEEQLEKLVDFQGECEDEQDPKKKEFCEEKEGLIIGQYFVINENLQFVAEEVSDPDLVCKFIERGTEDLKKLTDKI